MIDLIGAINSLVHAYGLTGLFMAAALGSTIFIPFSVEATIMVMVGIHADLLVIILVAGAGALVGTWFNYSLGYFASGYIKQKVGEESINKAHKFMDKYGWVGLFGIIFLPVPLPIPTDPITIIPGITRMNLIEFSIVVFVAKIARYAVFVGLFAGAFGFMNL